MYRELRDSGQCLWIQRYSFDDGYLCCGLKAGHDGGHRTHYDTEPREDQSKWSALEIPPEVELLDKIVAKIEAMEKDSFICWAEDAKNGYLMATGTLKKFIDTL